VSGLGIYFLQTLLGERHCLGGMNMERFEFSTAGRIIFGPGTLKEAGEIARSFGRAAFVVTSKGVERARPLLEVLNKAGVSYTLFCVRGEPTLDDVTAAVQQVKEWGADMIIGFGGGSPIDTAKAVAAMVSNPGDILDYLEVIGHGKPLTKQPIPCIAIPTTAGTGAEVTKNSVLLSEIHKIKVSLRHTMLLPRVAIVDPELTYDLPPNVTARTGCDALTQLIEAYVSSRANPMTDALCEEGLRRVGLSLKRAVKNGRDFQARYDMALASMLSGIALANAGLGVVHGLAGPVGGFTRLPHGTICAALLPLAMEVNISLLRTRGDNEGTLRKYRKIAELLTGKPDADWELGVEWIKQLVEDCGLGRLDAALLPEEAIHRLASQALQSSSTKSNPVPLGEAELVGILSRAVASK